MHERRRAAAKSVAIGVSAGLFALAVAQAQPGCDAGSAAELAKAKANEAAAPEPVATPEPPPADSLPPAEAPVDDAKAPVLGGAPDEAVKEPAVGPEEQAEDAGGEPDAAANAAPKRRGKRGREEKPETKVFLPATKSGAFIPREPPRQQQANAPVSQQ